MLNKLGQDYPYKRRSSPGLLKPRNESTRDYNIITCISKPTGPAQPLIKLSETLPQINLTKPRKLGDYVDFPYPKNKKNQEALIDFNSQAPSSKLAAIKAENADKGGDYQAKNLMNSSSVGYNFISNTNSDFPKTTKELRAEHATVTNRTKQIGTIYDQGRLFAPNFNPEYQSFFKTNQLAFNRNKGMCADTYNRAHTYGPGLKPFRKFK